MSARNAGKRDEPSETSFKRLEFVKSLIENVLGDNLRLFTGGGHEAGGGNGVDLPGNAGGELVDQVFDVGVKDFLRSAGSFEMEVNVRGGLRFGKRSDVVMYRDALSESARTSLLRMVLRCSCPERTILSWVEGSGVELMRSLRSVRTSALRRCASSMTRMGVRFERLVFINDLEEEPVFGVFRYFAELRDD